MPNSQEFDQWCVYTHIQYVQQKNETELNGSCMNLK